MWAEHTTPLELSALSRFTPFARAAALALALLAAPSLHAATYYWDTNDSTAGFGTAGGTWAAPTTNNSTQGWSASSAGTNTLSGNTTTSNLDALNFGTASAGLAAGTITVSGNVSANSLTFGSASGNITLSGGNITIGGTTPTITVNNASATITRLLGINTASGLTKNGTGKLVLQGGPFINDNTVPVTINGGTLRFEATTSDVGWAGNYTINNGATFESVGNNQRQTWNGSKFNFDSNGGGTVTFDTQNPILNNSVFTTTGGAMNTVGGTATFNGQGANTLTFNVATGTGAVGLQVSANLGNMNFIKSGNGVMTLTNAANSLHGGALTISAGTLEVASAGSFNSGSYNQNFTNNGTLSYNSTAAQTLSGVISGTGALSKSNTSTLTLSGNNTYTGGTTINAGTLQIGAGGTTGSLSTSSSITNNGTIVFNRTDTLTQGTHFNSVISGTGNLTQAGSGTLSLVGNNTYTGATTINAGTISIGVAGRLGAGSYSGNITNKGALIYSGTSDQTLSGVISGTGALTHNASSTLTLSGANTYNGATTVNAGTLSVSGNISSSALTLNTGAVISAGTNSSVAKFNAASLTIGAGSGYVFTIGNVGTMVAGTDYDQIALSGAVTLNNTAASPFTVYIDGAATGWSNSGVYSWDIISGASLSGVFTAGNFTQSILGSFGGNATGGTWSFSNPSTGIIQLTYTGVAGNSTWNTGTGDWNTAAQWVQNAVPVNFNNLIFNGAGGTSTNNISNATLTTVNNITFESGAGAYTIDASAGSAGASGGTALAVTGDITNNSSNLQTLSTALSFATTRTVNATAGDITLSGVISGAGGLTKTGSNTLTLSGANTYNGTTTVSAGALRAANSNALSSTSGNTTVSSGAALELSGGISIGAEALGLSGTGISSGGALRNISGNNSYAGAITLAAATRINSDANTLTLSGGITGTQNLTIGGAGDTTVSGNITISTGTLTKDGNGNLTLSGTNTYTGTTTVNAGTLTLNGGSAIANSVAVSVSSGAVLNLGASETIGSIAGAGNVTLGSSTLTAGGDNTSTTFSGNISGTSGGLTKAGTGTLTLSGVANNYNGTTTVNAGTLTLSGSLTSNANVYVGSASGAVLNITGNLTQTKTTGGPRGFQLAANGGQTGTVNVSGSGILNIGTGMMLGDNGGGNGTFNISGGTVTNSSETWFAGPNSTFNISGGSYTATSGWTYIGGGGNSNSPSTSTLTVNGTGTFTASTIDFGRGSTNATTIINIGDGAAGGTLSVSGLNYVQGPSHTINFNGGTLNVRSSISMITQAATVVKSGGAVIDVNSGQTFTISNNLTTDGTGGGLTKNGTGTLTLSGTNTYTGATTINIGTLTLSGGNAIVDTGAVSVSSGAVLNLSSSEAIGSIAGAGNVTLGSNTLTAGGGNTSTTFSGNISGTGGLTKAGTGTLTLNSSNSYTGTTTINAGTISMSHANALGTSGNITFGGGGLQYGSSITTDISSRIKNSGSAILIDTNSNNVTFASALDSTNTGGLTKNGTGILTLSANNTYTGATTINNGTVEITGSGQLGGGSYSGNISIGTNTFFLYNSSANQTLSGVISGAGRFDKYSSSASTLTLNGSNTMSGTFQMGVNGINSTAGTVKLMHNSALGTKFISWENDGTIELATDGLTIGNWMYIYNRASATDGKRRFLLDLAGTNSGTMSGNFDIRMDGTTFDVGADDTLTLSGNITNGAGAGAFTKTGAGTLVLTGLTISYSGATTISAGTLQVGAGGTTGSLTSGATKNVVNNGTLIFNRSDAITVANAISGSGRLIQNGTSTLTLNASNSYTGGTTLNAGTISMSHANALGTSGNITFGGGGLQYGSGITTDISSRIKNSGSAILIDTNSNNVTFASSVDSTNSGGLTKNGSGTLTLSNASNSYAGATTINAGTISISAVGALGSTSGVNLGNATELTYTGSAATLSRAISVTSGTATVANTGNGELTLSGGLAKNGTTLVLDGGSHGINVTGAITGSAANSDLVVDGNVTLSAANTYNGPTTINGNLTAAVTNAMGSTTNVVINSGGSLLIGANDAINDSADMTLAGGMLKFGGNFTENLGSLTLSANSVIDMGGGNIALEFTDLVAVLTPTTRLNIYNYTLGSDHLYFESNANLANSLQYISFYSGIAESSFIGNSFIEGANPYQVSPVPEPETWATGALLLLGGAVWMWRKRRNFTTEFTETTEEG